MEEAPANTVTCRPKKLRVDKGKGRAIPTAGDVHGPEEEGDGRFVELQSMLAAQSRKIDMLFSMWGSQAEGDGKKDPSGGAGAHESGMWALFRWDSMEGWRDC